MDLAAGAEVVVIFQDEVKISNPVLNRAASPESNHEPLVGVIRGQETGSASKVVRPVQLAVLYVCDPSDIQVELQQHLGTSLLD